MGFNVREAGARGDGRTDDTAAINAALAAPGGAYLPAGVYCTSGPLILPSDRPAVLRGDGVEVTEIRSTGSGYHAVQMDASARPTFYTGMPAQVRDLTISTTVNNPSAAIWIELFDLPFGHSINEQTAIIRDVLIRPEESATPASFGTGIHLSGCWNALIDNVTIHGDNTKAVMQTGIRLAKSSLDVNITNFRITNALTGIHVLDRCEGTIIRRGWIISNEGKTDGIVVNTRPGDATEPAKPWLSISNTHLSCSQFAVLVVNHPQCTIHDNLIYRWGSHGFRGIWLERGGDSHIHDNQIRNHSGAGSYGGIVLAATDCNVHDNTVTGIETIGIWLAPPTARCRVHHNTVGAGNIHNVGQGNVIVGNS